MELSTPTVSGRLVDDHQADIQHRKLNTSPSTVEDKDMLKKPLCEPMVRKIDLHFPLGLEVTARNLKGVTIKDALDAIHKQFKKKVCTLQCHCLRPYSIVYQN